MRTASFLTVLALAMPLAFAPPSARIARADEVPKNEDEPSVKVLHATVQILYATQAKEPFIDPQLGDDKYLRTRLSKPPFVSYNSYQLLARKKADLAFKASWQDDVAEGRRLHLSYVGMKEKRFRVAAMVDRADGRVFVKQLEVSASGGEPYFIAGQTYKDGILVLEISVSP